VTIVRRGDKYGARVYDRSAGKQRWLGTFDTVELAEAAEADATLTGVPTVAQWGRVWLSDYARPAAATRMNHRSAVARITKDLGSRALDDIGRREARQLAQGWPEGTYRVARAMWGDAVRDDIVTINPWTELRMPQPRGRKDLDALTEQEVLGLGAIAMRVHGNGYGIEAAAIVLTLGFVGVRPGELCALRHEDLLLDAAELIVCGSIDATGKLKSPKNGKERVVTVPPSAANALAQIPDSLDGLLFHTSRGLALNKGNLNYVWRPIANGWHAQGGRKITMYDLRHAAATHFIERGVISSDVAIQLGHTDGGRLVEQLYGHPKQQPARDRLKMAYATGAPARERQLKGYSS
jgi:integrase